MSVSSQSGKIEEGFWNRLACRYELIIREFSVHQEFFPVLAKLEPVSYAVITEQTFPNVALPISELSKEAALVLDITCHAFLPN
jgi:hypothetical protein